MNVLATQVAELYEAYRYLDAYDLTRAYWADEQLPLDLDIEGLVLAGRLAERLGSIRLCRARVREVNGYVDPSAKAMISQCPPSVHGMPRETCIYIDVFF